MQKPGGADAAETFVLIANTSAFAGQARVSFYAEDGTSAERVVPLLATSRTTINMSADVPELRGKRYGTIVEAVGATPPALVLERAMYSSPGGVTWAAGTNAVATPLP